MKILVLLFMVITGCCAKENLYQPSILQGCTYRGCLHNPYCSGVTNYKKSCSSNCYQVLDTEGAPNVPLYLRGASFVFSKKSKTTKLVLKPDMTEPLSSITVCLQAYTDNIQRDSLFKLANGSKSYFHLYNVVDYYYIDIDNVQVSYKISKESLEWRLICVSWESKTGLIQLVVNGNLFPRRVLKPGFLIDPVVTAVLGQDLNYYTYGDSYVGEIRQVNMWDRALRFTEMQFVYDVFFRRTGNIIDWDSVDYEIFGDVFLYKP